MSFSDTIAAISTAPGRGGVAVVRVSGPDAWAVAAKVTGREIGDSQAGRFFFSRFWRSGASADAQGKSGGTVEADRGLAASTTLTARFRRPTAGLWRTTISL